MQTGTVTSIVFPRGFGFIQPDDGSADDVIFFHATALQDLEFRVGLVGKAVEYDVNVVAGRERATSVWEAKHTRKACTT